MKAARSYLSVLVIASLLLVGCGDDTSTPDSGLDGSTPDVTLPAPDDRRPDAVTGDWILTSGTVDGVALVLVDGWDITLTVESGELGGTAACNGYGGFVDVGDGTFAVGEMSWTEMGCESAVMELEQSFLRALSAVTSFVVVDGTLTLTGPATELSFGPVAPVPDSEIVGTTWVLDTVIEGDAASNSPNMSAATLTLDDDGTLTGSTGCRLLEGEWVIAGAQIVFTSFAAIDDPLAGVCAPESERLDGFIVTVLGDGFTVEVEGSRMTLMSQGDQGLSYTTSPNA